MKAGKIKTFADEGKLRAFVASRTALKELLKEVLQTEGKWYKEKAWNNTNQGWAIKMVNIWVKIYNRGVFSSGVL